jgi:glycosyltransferase involved in cell wall biosynthesis
VLTLSPHCTYIRRSALELIGEFDESLTHPAAALADFAAAALNRGLSCVLADDVWVEPPPDAFPASPEAEMRSVSERHPWLGAARDDEAALDPGPLRRALVSARTARTHATVTIDARALGTGVGGTQTYIESLVLALVRSGRLTVRAVVSGDASDEVIERFAGEGVEIRTYEEAAAGLPRTDVVHRPQQVFTPHDLRLLHLLGDRVVISQLDLIAYRIPAYHASIDAWRAYRRATHLALGAADRVVFCSEHARRDAITEGLIEPGRTAIAGIGVEPGDRGEPPQLPGQVPTGRELLLLLGSDYQHKNRPFGLQLVDQLRKRHGWDGLLVLAGGHVPHGSSAETEAELLRERPDLAAHVLEIGSVSEPEKRWLMEHAAALLCPSTYEGFGLTPLEGALRGAPCIYPACTSLGDVIGSEAATIVPWDAAASADAAIRLLHDGPERKRHLDLLAAALRRYSWERVVEQLTGAYLDAIASPYRASAPRAWEDLKREELIVQLDSRRRTLEEQIAHYQPLIERDVSLTYAEQTGLMRVASREWLKRPLLGPFAIIGRVNRRNKAAAETGDRAARPE